MYKNMRGEIMKKIVDIGFRIKKINDLLAKRADRTMQEMGVTFAQHHALVYLVHQKDYTSTLKDMEHTFMVSQATMAGIVKRMEEKGYVQSFGSEMDKRIKLVRLTNKGEEICKVSRKLMEESEMKMRSLYSEEEMMAFEEYLERLFNALDKEDKNV